MEAGSSIGSRLGWWIAEHRARRISDPVAKLRFLRGTVGRTHAVGVETRARRHWRRAKPALIAALILLPIPTISDVRRRTAPPPPAVVNAGEPAVAAPKSVWLVEETKTYETYSNGLRVENNYTVGNEERRYPVFDRDDLLLVGWRSAPVGIVYHTTESHQAPFASEHNRRLRRVGRWLLEYVQRKRSYHFIVDRFGRVHRIVQETDSANHAGYSVWADASNVYVNLNSSFIGVSFETETVRTDEGASINQAQIHAANVLTQMLRSKYGIAAENCVTHAQVSVYSRAMRVGNHIDWAASFPFGVLGLGGNYSLPHGAVAVFGFEYGQDFLEATGEEMWKGMANGKESFRRLAAKSGVPVAKYRAARKRKYQKILEVIEEAKESREQGT